MGGLRHRCSVSLLNGSRSGLGSSNKNPVPSFAISYRAQLGRLGGSRSGLGSSNKNPVPRVSSSSRAQLGRVGGSRSGLGSCDKIPCHALSLSLSLSITNGSTQEARTKGCIYNNLFLKAPTCAQVCAIICFFCAIICFFFAQGGALKKNKLCASRSF